MRKYIIIFIVLFTSPVSSQNTKLFDDATVAYNEGKYEEAISNYLKILENGEHSSALYYNLGNAYYKTNQIAPSIYYFEKALILNPNDTEILNNLAFAQSLTLDAIQQLPESSITKAYNSFAGLFSFDQWAYLAVFFMLLFILAYIAFYYFRYPRQKRIAFTSSLVFLGVALLSITFAYLEYNNYKQNKPAIVFSEAVVIKSEPNTRSQELFTLHEGTKVNILETLDDWKKIEIGDGKIGWIPKDAIKSLVDF